MRWQITYFTTYKFKDEIFLSELKSLNANLQVAFRMLPKVVWEMPSLELSTFIAYPSWSCTYQLGNHKW
jgi:hypothetical protein